MKAQKAKSSSSSSPFPVGPSPAKEEEWRSEDDHRTLSRAAEIQGDRHRLAGARKHHRKAVRSLAQVNLMMGGRR